MVPRRAAMNKRQMTLNLRELPNRPILGTIGFKTSRLKNEKRYILVAVWGLLSKLNKPDM